MAGFLNQYLIFVIIAGLLAAFWLLINLFGRHLKKTAEIESMSHKTQPVAEVMVNTRVILDSGIHGSIKEIKKRTFMVEIAPGVVIEVEKYGVVFVSDQEGQKNGRVNVVSSQLQTAENA